MGMRQNKPEHADRDHGAPEPIAYVGTAEARGRANPTHLVRDTRTWTARCSSAVFVIDAYPVPADVDVASQVGCKSCLRLLGT